MEPVEVEFSLEEKAAIRFPEYVQTPEGTRRVIATRIDMVTADYRLRRSRKGWIERKGKPEELHKCFLGDDRERTEKQLSRLAAGCSCPILLVDSSPYDVLAHRYRADNGGASPTQVVGEQVIEAVTTAALRHGLHLVWVPRVDSHARMYAVGQVVLCLLLGAERAP
jgi:hypothetical protein